MGGVTDYLTGSGFGVGGRVLHGLTGLGPTADSITGKFTPPALPGVTAPAGPGDKDVEAARRARLAQFAAQGRGATLLTGASGDDSAQVGKTLLGSG